MNKVFSNSQLYLFLLLEPVLQKENSPVVFIALERELRMELILPRSTLAKFTGRGAGLTTGAATGVVVKGEVFAGGV